VPLSRIVLHTIYIHLLFVSLLCVILLALADSKKGWVQRSGISSRNVLEKVKYDGNKHSSI